jgi:hypothetical protein
LNLNIFLSENTLYKESKFYFKIDKKKYIRKIIYKNNIPVTSINYKMQNKKIKNPMSMNLNSVFNLKKYNLTYKNNKKVTDFIFFIKKQLLNNES